MAMIDVFLKGIGFDPVEFQAGLIHYKNEFDALKSEMDAMKTGLQSVVAHFNACLKRIEAKTDVSVNNSLVLISLMDDMEALLNVINTRGTDLSHTNSGVMTNGHHREHGRDREHGHDHGHDHGHGRD